MHRFIIFALLVLSLFTASLFAAAGDMGVGTQPLTDGSAEYPYLIEDFADFQAFCADDSYWTEGVHTRLETDLDLDPALPGRQTYTTAPIAPDTDFYPSGIFDGTPFSGVFDGNGHSIANLTISISSREYIGLFGKIDKDESEIKNLALENISINGWNDLVGGITGDFNYGRIINCYSTGSIKGAEKLGGLVGENYFGEIINSYSSSTVESYQSSGYTYVGGLVGENSGLISKCYSSGEVRGASYVGGLVGKSWAGAITNCYSIGEVYGSGNYTGGLIGSNGISNRTSRVTNCYSTGKVSCNGDYVGGLVGHDYNDGQVTDSYFYIYGGLDNDCGLALDDEQLQSQYSFSGFDFSSDPNDGLDDIWSINQGYMPRLSWQEEPGFAAPYVLDAIITTLAGTGYPGDPFIISDYNDLMEFKSNTNLRMGNYSLINDIDLNSALYAEALIVEPFGGNLNGNGNSIFNLNINGQGNLGFFRKLYGSVNNLKIENISVSGSDDCIGGLTGYNYGTINSCQLIGEVTGIEFVGGISGRNYDLITNSHSYVEVNGSRWVGNVTGINYGTISQTSSNAEVTGDQFVGGISGENVNYIFSCNSLGKVSTTGSNNDGCVGGLCGKNNNLIKSCYSTADVKGGSFSDYAGGLCGYNSGTITISYSNGLVTGYYSDYLGGLCGYNDEGNIEVSYSHSSIMAGAYSSDYVGGLIGYNYYGIIKDCYSTGLVSRGDDYVGGFCGKDWSGSIISCFWDVNTSGVGLEDDINYGAVGKTTAQMMTISNFTDAGWDFLEEAVNGTNDVWRLCCEGMQYPQLNMQYYSGDIACPDGVNFIDYSYLSTAWSNMNNYHNSFDLNEDSVFDLYDIKILAENWLK